MRTSLGNDRRRIRYARRTSRSAAPSLAFGSVDAALLQRATRADLVAAPPQNLIASSKRPDYLE